MSIRSLKDLFLPGSDSWATKRMMSKCITLPTTNLKGQDVIPNLPVLLITRHSYLLMKLSKHFFQSCSPLKLMKFNKMAISSFSIPIFKVNLCAPLIKSYEYIKHIPLIILILKQLKCFTSFLQKLYSHFFIPIYDLLTTCQVLGLYIGTQSQTRQMCYQFQQNLQSNYKQMNIQFY